MTASQRGPGPARAPARRPARARAGCALRDALATAAVLLAAACSPAEEVESSQGSREGEERGAGAARLARIHVIVQATPDPLGSEPQLDVTARFARYRGLDDDFVRARVGVAPLASERLAVGQCLSAELLEAVDASERRPAGARELQLIDAGNLRLRLAGAPIEVPLVLLPDLLPYMSGVEYAQVIDAMPSVFSLVGERAPVTIDLEGSSDEEVPATSLQAHLPRPLELETVGTFERDVLELSWRPDAATAGPVVVRLASYVGSEPLGNEVICALADTGGYRLDLRDLRDLGLGAVGEGLRVSASRAAVTSFDAGEFVGGELILEIRDTHFVVP